VLRFLASLISIVFQPLLLPIMLIGSLMVFYSELFSPLSWEQNKWLLLLIAITTFFIPLLSIVLMRLLGNITSIHMAERQERVMPFFFIAVFYLLTTWMMWQRLSIVGLMGKLLLVIGLTVLLLAVITLFFKVSAHGMAAGGSFAILWVLALQFPELSLYPAVSVSSLICGMVISARLQLQAHTFFEACIGALIGFVFCFVSLLLIL
jgi:hypothetical protein